MGKRNRTTRNRRRHAISAGDKRRDSNLGRRESSSGISARGEYSGRGDESPSMVYRVRDWQRIYESDPKGVYGNGSRYPMLYVRIWVNNDKYGNVYRAEIDGQRRACIDAGGYELLGAMLMLLTLAADKPAREMRGHLLNFRGRPMTTADIASYLHVPVAVAHRWLELLSSPQVAFLERIELSGAIREQTTLEAGNDPVDKEPVTHQADIASEGGASSPNDGDGDRQENNDAAASVKELGKPPPVDRSDADLAANLKKDAFFLDDNQKKSATSAVILSKKKIKKKKKREDAVLTASDRTALSGLKKNGIARDPYIVTETQEKEQEAHGQTKTQEPQQPAAFSPVVAAGATAPDPGRTDAAGGPGCRTDASGHAPSPCRPPVRNEAVWTKLRQTEPMATWGELWADQSRRKLACVIARALGVQVSSGNRNRDVGAICNGWLNSMATAAWTEAEQLEFFEKALEKAWALKAQELEAARGERKPINARKVYMHWWKQFTSRAIAERVSQHV